MHALDVRGNAARQPSLGDAPEAQPPSDDPPLDEHAADGLRALDAADERQEVAVRLLGVADPAGARRAEDGQRRDGRGGGREFGRRGEARGRGGEEGGERGRRGGRRVEVGAALEELEAGFSEREGAREGRVEDEPAGGCERSADTLQQTLVLGRGTHRKPRRCLKNRRRPVIVVASDRSYSAARLATDCGETERMGTSSCDPGADHEVSSCDGRSAAVDEADVGRTGCSLRTRYTSSCDWSETRTDSADVMQPLQAHPSRSSVWRAERDV